MVNDGAFRLPPVDTVVLSASPGEWRAASLRDGIVWGLDWHWPDRPSLVGGVFAIRVTRMAPAARGAFVVTDGQGSEGFLDLSRSRGASPHEGERLLAQVTRMPEPGKRLTLSPAIRLAGRYLVYTPSHPGVSASRQLPRAAAASLQGAVKRALRPDEGAIVRAAAGDLADAAELLLNELERHRAVWTEIGARSGLGQVAEPPSLAETLLLERPGTGPLLVIADAASAAAAVRDTARIWAPTEPIAVSLDTADPYAAHGGEAAMEQALGPEIPLPSGGTLWLEATRACSTADVDSGSAHGAAAEIRRQANREAAVELARQIRLRQAAGAFVADFLRMDGRAEQTAVIQHLQAAFAEDPARLHFNPGFDSLGLYAFSRGRIAAPFASRLDDGGLCQAVLAGLRSLVRNSLAEPHRRLALHVAPAAAVAAQGLPTALEDCKRQLGLAPSIVSDAALARTDFVVRPADAHPTERGSGNA